MGKIFKLTVIILVGFIFSCATVKKDDRQIEKTPEDYSPQSNFIEDYKVYPKQSFTNPPPMMIKPAIEKVSPLEGKVFTFSADHAPLKTVLYAIAKDTGLNLIISPDVPADATITANFNNTPIKTALEIITDMAGVYYDIKGNVIYISLTKTRTFHIPYVHANSTYSADLGGDVLGSSEGSSTTGGTSGGYSGGGATSSAASSSLSGDFSLSYENPEDFNNFYYQLENNLKGILGEGDTDSPNRYILNKFSGTLIVTATKDKMKQIKKLISNLRKDSRKQVLIEARIIEVALGKEFRYGIDWNLLMRNFLGTGASVQLVQNLALDTAFGSVYVTGADFQSVLNALERTGELETLSSPRIRVLNGQTALISSGVVIPFWEKRVSTVTGTTSSQQVYYIRTNVLDGVLLGVTPYIENDSIIMNIVPVSTKIEDVRQLVENGNVIAEAPVLNVKEAGTIVKVKDGDLIIIGGLIGTDKRKVVSKVPGLGDIPGLGVLFRKEEYIKQKRELIIFLRPRIIKVH